MLPFDRLFTQLLSRNSGANGSRASLTLYSHMLIISRYCIATTFPRGASRADRLESTNIGGDIFEYKIFGRLSSSPSEYKQTTRWNREPYKEFQSFLYDNHVLTSLLYDVEANLSVGKLVLLSFTSTRDSPRSPTSMRWKISFLSIFALTAKTWPYLHERMSGWRWLLSNLSADIIKFSTLDHESWSWVWSLGCSNSYANANRFHHYTWTVSLVRFEW